MDALTDEKHVVNEIFYDYDIGQIGELTPEQLQMLYGEIRLGSLSVPQVKQAIKYVCIGSNCEKTELLQLLQEMDRRYFLIQDFRWEFSMLDHSQTNTISEEQAKWFLQTVYGEYFSNRQWEKFLRSRVVPGSGVTFVEIEVMLCNIPSKQEYFADLEADRKEKEEWERSQREHQLRKEEEQRRRQLLREEERQRQEEEELRRLREENKRRKEEEQERLQKQREKEDFEKKREQMEEDEERGRREAEERENANQAKKEKEAKDKREKRRTNELKEANRLRELQERRQKEEDERRRREMEEAGDLEQLYLDSVKREKEAGDEAEGHLERHKNATDEATKKDALESEKRARQKAREYRNKKIRFNLKVAIRKRDQVRLPPAVDDFKKAKLPDDDMDLPKAEALLREFQARDGLKKAMTSRQIQALEKAINYVKMHGFELQLTHELIEANKILLQLRRLERIRAEILELKQSTVAEIRSYQKPPPIVHVVMTATFLLLGHKEKETKDWKTVQALVGKTGKEGLKRRCLGLEPNMIDINTAKRSKDLMSGFDLDDVRDVSAGAATFYLWGWTMIEELESQMLVKQHEEEEAARMEKEQEAQAAEAKASAAASTAESETAASQEQ